MTGTRVKRAPVVFLQAFGRRDLFTGVPPEELWGWRRNVGLLVALLDRMGIPWEERYAPSLDEVEVKASLLVLRDWRYPAEQVARLRRRYDGTPLIAMLFQCPQPFLQAQRRGEERVLGGIVPPAPLPPADAEAGVFLADRVVVRSRLNADLFAELGYPRDKMVLMPHAPLWTLRDGNVVPAVLPPRPAAEGPGLDVLFIGESLWRKGFFRLYQALGRLPVADKRLHVYNSTLCRGRDADWPAAALDLLARIRANPMVRLCSPYRDQKGLLEAHHRAGLIACPSLLDCGPNVLVEAYQLGTPILASQLCGALGDLPPGATYQVQAPCWWREEEEGEAFTDRLEEMLVHIIEHPVETETLEQDHIAGMLGAIVVTWQTLLEEYLGG